MSRILRRSAAAAIAACTLGLAACGGGDTIEAENESVESVAAKVANSGVIDVRPSPGRWESQMKIVNMEIAGMPKDMQGMMKGQIGRMTTSTSCLTKEEAEKSDKEFFKPSQSSNCKYNSFSMGGGKIDADMTCEDADATQDMKMSGTYGADAYTMNVSSEGNMGGQQMSMQMEIASKRVGDCDGSEQG